MTNTLLGIRGCLLCIHGQRNTLRCAKSTSSVSIRLKMFTRERGSDALGVLIYISVDHSHEKETTSLSFLRSGVVGHLRERVLHPVDGGYHRRLPGCARTVPQYPECGLNDIVLTGARYGMGKFCLCREVGRRWVGMFLFWSERLVICRHYGLILQCANAL